MSNVYKKVLTLSVEVKPCEAPCANESGLQESSAVCCFTELRGLQMGGLVRGGGVIVVPFTSTEHMAPTQGLTPCPPLRGTPVGLSSCYGNQCRCPAKASLRRDDPNNPQGVVSSLV